MDGQKPEGVEVDWNQAFLKQNATQYVKNKPSYRKV
jgi:hypothetical protein